MRRSAGALLLAWCLAGCLPLAPSAPTPAANTKATSPVTVASPPRITPPPVTPPTPPGENLPAFACANGGGGATGVAGLTAVRMDEQTTYDRFVLQFNGTAPTYTVKRQAKATFVMQPSGQPVLLAGSAGVLVSVHSATAANTYSGPADFIHPELHILKESRMTQDFEGVVSWALGLSTPACMRTFTLTNPGRLVVDFTITSP
jgi:hypothetical protein